MPHAEGPRVALVLLAAGEGRRVGHDTNKVLLPLAGRRVFTYAAQWALTVPWIVRVVLVIRESDRAVVESTLPRELPDTEVELVVGGATRHDSEYRALEALRSEIEAGGLDVVVIHDAARPLASGDLFEEVIAAAHAHGGALPVCDQPALISIDGDTVERRRTVAVQTPQAFLAAPLLSAYTQAAAEDFVGTDTASCVEHFTDLRVRCVPGDAANVKITYPEDLFLAERLLAKAGWDLSSTTGEAP